MKEKTKLKYNQVKLFTLQFARLIVTACFLGLGGYAIYLGRINTVRLNETAYIFAGGVVSAYGLVELYKTLTRKA